MLKISDACQAIVWIFLLLLGGGMTIAGFAVTPLGEIHESILVLFGEILTFLGTSLFGVHVGVKIFEYFFNRKKL